MTLQGNRSQCALMILQKYRSLNFYSSDCIFLTLESSFLYLKREGSGLLEYILEGDVKAATMPDEKRTLDFGGNTDPM